MWSWLDSGGPYSSGAATSVVTVMLLALAFLAIAKGLDIMRARSVSIDFGGLDRLVEGPAAHRFALILLGAGVFCLVSVAAILL